jgi:hypothetical protein
MGGSHDGVKAESRDKNSFFLITTGKWPHLFEFHGRIDYFDSHLAHDLR